MSSVQFTDSIAFAELLEAARRDGHAIVLSADELAVIMGDVEIAYSPPQQVDREIPPLELVEIIAPPADTALGIIPLQAEASANKGPVPRHRFPRQIGKMSPHAGYGTRKRGGR